MPKGGTVDGVVGFAKVDETGVCWGVELSGMAEDLGEGEELVGGSSAATETSLMFEDGGLHAGRELVKEEEGVDFTGDREEADPTVVSTGFEVAFLEDGDDGRVLPILRGSFGSPDDGDDLMEPFGHGITTVFEHFCCDEAHTRGFTVLESFDSCCDRLEGWRRVIFGEVNWFDGVQDLLVNLEVGIEELGKMLSPPVKFIFSG